MSTDEDNVHEDATLSHIASKMPTPPPRPASISSARSSKRSSSVVSQSRQSRLQSMADGEISETPPTPSLSCVYNARSTKNDSSQSPVLSINTSLNGETKKTLSSPNATKSSRNRAPSLGAMSLVNMKRSQKALKEKSIDTDGIKETAEAISRPSSKRKHGYISEERAERLQQALYASADLGLDIIEASYLVASVAFSPVYERALHFLQSFQHLEVAQASVQSSVEKVLDKEDVAQLSLSFAQRFKTIICSSHLLSKSLTVSHYAEEADSMNSVERSKDLIQPTSVHLPEPTILKCKESATDLSSASFLLFDAAVIASMMLAPICRDGNAWTRSTVLLISFVWSFFYLTNASQSDEILFELTHKSTGQFTLLKKDLEDEDSKGGEYLASSKAIALSGNMCEMAQDLVKSCQNFDIECNKSIALVQEVELVSRGFKLSRPFPPISRIEATDSAMSPLHDRSFKGIPPQSAPAVVGVNSRLSRSSSSGGSSVSGWKHLGPRPQSILLPNTAIATGRSSPYSSDVEMMRLASLRKSLAVTFDTAKVALEKAIEEVKPLADEKELSLLEEMYDVHHTNTHDSGLSPISEPWSAVHHSALTERSASGTPMGRGKNGESEMQSSTDDDSACLPMTPQLGYFPLENHSVGLYSKPRRRDSSASEAWSATSPMRETPPPIRGGSRLGYISDKTVASSTTPNQTGASKRLSYIASAANAGAHPIMQGRPSHMKTSSSSVSFGNQAYRKRLSLLNSNILDDHTQVEVEKIQPRLLHPHLIASLKASFESIHSLRRRLLCHLLAFDITLKRKAVISQSISGEIRFPVLVYLSTIEGVMKQVKESMSRLAAETKALIEREVSDAACETGEAGAESTLRQKGLQSFPGIQDKLTGMGQALRSIQVKMRACSEELHLKVAPALHGSDVSPISSNSLHVDKPERLLETVREDLLTLSAEWESALKILQLAQQQQEMIRSTSANADVTSSTLTTSRLDSPQEADEDALRQWVPFDKDAISKSENEQLNHHDQTSNGILEWTSKGERDSTEKESELSELLVKSASPDHLPPPGLEKVYESMSQVAEMKIQKSIMTREERIQMAKEQRAMKEKSRVDGDMNDPSAGMIRELQSVMKSRKGRSEDLAQIKDAQSHQESRLHTLYDSKQQQQQRHYDTSKQSSTDSTAAFAF